MSFFPVIYDNSSPKATARRIAGAGDTIKLHNADNIENLYFSSSGANVYVDASASLNFLAGSGGSLGVININGATGEIILGNPGSPLTTIALNARIFNDLHFLAANGSTYTITADDASTGNNSGDNVQMGGAAGFGGGQGGSFTGYGAAGGATGAGGGASLLGGSGGSTSGAPGGCSVIAGSALGGNTDGADVVSYAGAGHGTGKSGRMFLGHITTRLIQIGLSSTLVGVATSAPTAILTVGSTPHTTLGALEVLQVNRSGACAMTVQDNTGVTVVGSDGSGLAYTGAESNHDYILVTNNTERMRITNGGIVGIAQSTPKTNLHIGNRTIVQDTVGTQTAIANNTFFDGSNWKYIQASTASAIRQISGDISFHSNPSGSAGGTISNMDTTDAKMIIKGGGFVGIGPGNTAPRGFLDVKNSANSSLEFYLDSGTSSGQNALIWYADQGTTKWALYKRSDNDFGVYSSVLSKELVSYTSSNSGRVGILTDGTTAPDQVLTVNGNASKSGGGTWATYASDERLKDIVGDVEYGLAEIMELRPIRYRYKKDNPLKLDSDTIFYGFTAQNVQKVMPDAVVDREEDGFLRIESFDPILWGILNGLKEVAQDNIDLAKRVAALEAR